MGSIIVEKPGMLSTIQDKGRYGYSAYGIPISGVMDTWAMDLANILVGNDRDEAVLEMTILGPSLRFNASTIIAITGGDLSPMLNNRPIDMYMSYYINSGDVLSFGPIKNGSRAYMAVAGGFDVEVVMESKSTYLRGGFGGYKGRKLEQDDIIKLRMTNSHFIGNRVIPNHLRPSYSSHKKIRVVMGQEASRFKKDSINTFLNTEYRLSNSCDRMGYRLKGLKLEHVDNADIISGGITFGTVQVPGDGQPIIMMADRQTTGGYTKIANVISMDLPFVAQLKSGDSLRFECIDIEEAHDILLDYSNSINRLEEEFKNRKNNIILGDRRDYKISINNKTYDIQVRELQDL